MKYLIPFLLLLTFIGCDHPKKPIEKASSCFIDSAKVEEAIDETAGKYTEFNTRWPQDSSSWLGSYPLYKSIYDGWTHWYLEFRKYPDRSGNPENKLLIVKFDSIYSSVPLNLDEKFIGYEGFNPDSLVMEVELNRAIKPLKSNYDKDEMWLHVDRLISDIFIHLLEYKEIGLTDISFYVNMDEKMKAFRYGVNPKCMEVVDGYFELIRQSINERKRTRFFLGHNFVIYAVDTYKDKEDAIDIKMLNSECIMPQILI